MTLANLPGANRGLESKLEAILEGNSEPARPTESQEPEMAAAEEPVNNVKTEAETQLSDTEPKSRRLTTKLGDREVEYEILSDISDEDAEVLRLGSMMEQDYRTKTMDLSKERKKLESEAEKLNGKVAELEGILSYDANWLESDEAKELREDDPDSYLTRIDSIKRKAEVYQKFKAEQQEKAQEKYQEQIQGEIAKYSQVIPDWLDESKRDSDLLQIEKTLSGAGFDKEFIGSVWGMDHRFMSLLRKAALFDLVQSKNLKVKETVKKQKSLSPEAKQDPKVKTKTQKVKEDFRANRNDKRAQQQLFESFL